MCCICPFYVDHIKNSIKDSIFEIFKFVFIYYCFLKYKIVNFAKFHFFAISKMAKYQFFELGKSLKLPKMQFHVKKIFHLFVFRSFLPGLFLIFWPVVPQCGGMD